MRLGKFTPEFDGADKQYCIDLINSSFIACISWRRQWKQESEEERTSREAKGKPRPTTPFLDYGFNSGLENYGE